MLFTRFEFDLSMDEVRQRELSVCVKNASSSFMNRDKDVMGQVSLSSDPLLKNKFDWNFVSKFIIKYYWRLVVLLILLGTNRPGAYWLAVWSLWVVSVVNKIHTVIYISNYFSNVCGCMLYSMLVYMYLKEMPHLLFLSGLIWRRTINTALDRTSSPLTSASRISADA